MSSGGVLIQRLLSPTRPPFSICSAASIKAVSDDEYIITPLAQTLVELEADFQQQFYLKTALNGTIAGTIT